LCAISARVSERVDEDRKHAYARAAANCSIRTGRTRNLRNVQTRPDGAAPVRRAPDVI
jgi:hypothetical protein